MIYILPYTHNAPGLTSSASSNRLLAQQSCLRGDCCDPTCLHLTRLEAGSEKQMQLHLGCDTRKQSLSPLAVLYNGYHTAHVPYMQVPNAFSVSCCAACVAGKCCPLFYASYMRQARHSLLSCLQTSPAVLRNCCSPTKNIASK